MKKIPNNRCRFRDLRFVISNLFRISDFGFWICKRGFTLLFAVLVGSLLFSIGIAIANIAIREVVLSAAGKQSEIAFYAADSGAECALYWDIQEKKFPAAAGGVLPTFACAKKIITAEKVDSIDGGAMTSFTLLLGDTAEAACAKVEVSKTAQTKIESRGRNECGTGDNPKRVERAIRVRY